ncbi:hypothetical protein [Spirochaeta cellobiosiphila]|uniref:hypothetical protein n=1 Tax=Spirochaeta cellobiosiphila TaxID=504483 RepID=UPI00048D85DC|nr:hypothetical protein [Spirochaeta cellobiosiphila]
MPPFYTLITSTLLAFCIYLIVHHTSKQLSVDGEYPRLGLRLIAISLLLPVLVLVFFFFLFTATFVIILIQLAFLAGVWVWSHWIQFKREVKDHKSSLDK